MYCPHHVSPTALCVCRVKAQGRLVKVQGRLGDVACTEPKEWEKKSIVTTHHSCPHWHVISHLHGIVGIACGTCTQNMISKQQERVTYLVTESHVEEGRGSQSGQERVACGTTWQLCNTRVATHDTCKWVWFLAGWQNSKPHLHPWNPCLKNCRFTHTCAVP